MKKRNKLLPILLLLSSLAVAALGGYIKYGVLQPLGIQRDESIIAMPFVLWTDQGLQFMVQMNQEAALQAATKPTEEETVAPETTEAATEIATEAPTQAPTEAPVETVPETEPPTEPVPTEPAYVELDESWFDDALFIGDSRTRGMQNDYRLGNAWYFTSIGMNIYNVFTTWAGDRDFEDMSLESLLQEKTFGKILIGIGLNECNYEHTYIKAGFERLIALIQSYQPDAKIILQSIMMVTEKHSRYDKSFQKENLNAINEILASFADGETIFYIDSNEWVVDETGYLPTDMTFDGVHFYGSGYAQWRDWIKMKCGTLGIP